MDSLIALQSISLELSKQGKTEDALKCANTISHDSYRISALKDISTELAKQGKLDESTSAMQEALSCARDIRDESAKSSALKDISTELAKQGKVNQSESVMQEALSCAKGISGDKAKCSVLAAISTELAKQGKLDEAASAMQDAISCARGISFDTQRSSALTDISTELAKQGKIDEALACIRDESDKSSALQGISAELAKQGNWSLAETIGGDISQTRNRHSCWKIIAERNFEKMGWQQALQCSENLLTPEAKKHYLKSLSVLVKSIESRSELILTASRYFLEDLGSLENLLQQHALHALFFVEVSEDKVDRLNRTLNIQWAIDVKNKLESNE
jgi:tetratricopeptide (TPR) repeat protein